MPSTWEGETYWKEGVGEEVLNEKHEALPHGQILPLSTVNTSAISKISKETVLGGGLPTCCQVHTVGCLTNDCWMNAHIPETLKQDEQIFAFKGQVRLLLLENARQ